jgi:hypothetical protein
VFKLEADIADTKAFRVQLTLLDWDKLSSDDHFDSAAIEISEVADKISKKDPEIGLFLRMKTSLVRSKVINSFVTAEGNAVLVENIP